MEHNDQVHDEPLAGKSGEIKMDSSEEKNSSVRPSETKEEIVPETTEVAETSSGEKDNSVAVSVEKVKEPPIE